MTTSVQSLPELIVVLNSAIKHNSQGLQQITLDGDLFAQAGILAGYLSPGPLIITQNKGQPLLVTDATSAKLNGVASLFGNALYDVAWIGTVPQTTPLLLMTASPTAGQTWSFAGEFPGLPSYTGNDRGALLKKESFFETIAITAPVFTVSTYADTSSKIVDGLSLAGTLDVTQGELAPIGGWIPNAAALALDGTIGVRSGTFALVDLSATVTLDIPKLSGVAIVLAAVDPPAIPLHAQAASTVTLSGKLSIAGVNPVVTAPLLQGDLVWSFTVSFGDDGLSLTSGLSELSEFVSDYPLTLPPGLDALSWLALQELVVGVVPPSSLTLKPALQFVGVTVGSAQRWELPIPGVAVGDLATQWVIISPLASPSLMGQVVGKIYLGSDSDSPRLDVTVKFPSSGNVAISGDLDTRYPVKLGQVFSKFTGGTIDLDLDVSHLDLLVTPATRELYIYCVLEGDWPTPIPEVEFTQLNFYIEYSPNSLSGSATVAVTIAKANFAATALHPGSGQGWQFSGGLLPGQTLTVSDFLTNLLPAGWPGLPDSLQSLEITALALSFDTLTHNKSFEAALDWRPTFAGRQWDIAADFLFVVTHVNGQAQHSGHVAGSISVDQFQVGVAYEFATQNSSSLTFRIQYNGASLTCTLTENDKQQHILTANLGGVTFGEIVDYLVNLVDSSQGFSLSSPWDVLNEINFDNLTLTVNLTTKAIGVSYALNQDLGIVDIATIGLTYVNKVGRKTVDIAITGQFFEQVYDENNPLAWDLLNDPPPTPPGKGPEFLDLRYLGIGQNVGFRATQNFRNVQDVIAALEAEFPPPNPQAQGQNPLTSSQLSNLKFTADGRWLIGADMTFIGAISLSVVFNDPTLYGIRIALSGDEVKNFSGLEFEVLYKKVTDTIGVYDIELALPEAFRQMQFGAVSVSLPIVGLDIYTNGDFRVDLGFPVGLDFSGSFCVQAGPFTGAGGFYFALLDGSTAERLPKVSNGSFSPVIEAGLALSVGMGRSINEGVISAGASVTMVTVIQGVFGWFNPDDRSAGKDLYYWVEGTAAVVGHLYGTVNFYIVQASLNATADAEITLIIESHEPIKVRLVVRVEVSASVKVLFIRVTLSFSTHVDLSFTIGSGSPTPWIVDASKPSALLLRQQIAPQGRRRLSGAALLARALGPSGATGMFDWTPRKVFDEVQGVALSLVPALTVASPQAVFATRDTAGGATGPQYQAVMSLFAANSVPPQARRARDVQTVEMSDAARTPFNLLVRGMLKWALSSYRRPPGPLGLAAPATDYALASDLDAISKYLGDAANWQSAFNYAALAELMKLNYVLEISSPLSATAMLHPDGPLPFGATAPEVSATLFPIIPDLEMTPTGLTAINFRDYHCIDRDYEDALAAYYSQLRVPTAATGPGPSGYASRGARRSRATAGPQGCTGGLESLSTFVFRDYFSMVTKGALSSAIDLLKAYPYEPTGAGATGYTGPTGHTESLASIAQSFSGLTLAYRSRRGDTIGTLAGRFGLSPADITEANPHLALLPHRSVLPPGTSVVIDTGVKPAAIAKANQNYPLQFRPGQPVTMTISGVKHQVSAPHGKSESLSTICANYWVPDPATVFAFQLPSVPPANPNAGNSRLLEPGAPMTIPAQTFKVISAADDSAELVAALFFVRSIGPAQPDQKPWYSYLQFYTQWMQDNPNPSGPTLWQVPVVAMQPDGTLKVTGSQQYAPQGGASGPAPLSPDTMTLAAGYFAMTQLAPEPFGDAFNTFQHLVSASGPQTYAVAEFPYTVQPGDTMAGVAQRFGLALDDLVHANAGASGLMQPLAVLALPTLSYPIGEGDTLASVASEFDLTLDELTDSIKENPGILQPYAPQAATLTIPDVPGRATAELFADLVRLGRFNNVSGMVTRFLLHGMRLPQPGAERGKVFPTDTPLWGLYEMTGQQFPVGASGPVGQIDIVFRKGATADWICLDPAPRGPSAPSGPSASGGPTGCKDELVVPLGSGFFANPPSLTLAPVVLSGPAPLPLYRDAPPRYAMADSIHWQAATPPQLPGPTGAPRGGQPSIWTFPSMLLDIAAQGPTAPPYKLALPSADDQSGDIAIAHYCWASAVDVRIQQVPAAAASQYLPNSYVLLGTDQEGRDQLLAAFTYLQQFTPPYGQLYILYSPSATSNNAKGLASDPLDPTQTFLLKTNLTTVTHSDPELIRYAVFGQSIGTSHARLAAIPDFLRLVWEASVTGSGGFYLNYVNSNGGGGLPDTVFANGDIATITLLLLADSQGPLDPGLYPDRGLYPFNNCAVVGDNIDTGSTRPYARLAAPTPADLVRVASVPAGRAGFYMVGLNPDPGATGNNSSLSPTDETRNLYSLVGFRIAANQDFTASNHGLPISPTDTPVKGVSGPTGPSTWWYHQILPVYRFGNTNDTPASAALPQVAENPYAGITGPTGNAGRPLSQVEIDLDYHDVYGNRIVATPPLGPLTLPAGYIDNLIGVSSWPGAAADFVFRAGSDGSVVLDTRLSLQVDKYAPSGSYGFDQSSKAAIADAGRYTEIFYQVQQSDLGFTLSTNLGAVSTAADALQPAGLKAAMTAFVSKAKVFADAAASQQQQTYSTNQNDQLGAIAGEFAVTTEMLVSENAGQPVAPLFQGQIVQPIFAVAGPGNTLVLLVANEISTPFPPVCGPSGPADCASEHGPFGIVRLVQPGYGSEHHPLGTTGPSGPALTPVELLSNNQTAPLTPGIVLRTAPRVATVPTGLGLAAAAAFLQCSVYAVVADSDAGVGPTPIELGPIAIGLFADNYTTTGVVAPNLNIEIDGKTISTGTSPTLKSVQGAFAALGLDVGSSLLSPQTGDFVVKLSNVPNILAADAQLTFADYVVPSPPPARPGPAAPVLSIANLPAGCGTLELLAQKNRIVPNFFYAGTALYIGACCYQPEPQDTFTSLAAQFNVTIDQLAKYNADAPLQANVSLLIPNLTYLGNPTSVYAPYSALTTDSLDSIAKTFSTTADVIAALNQNLPGIFADHATITIGKPFTPTPLDSLQSAADWFALPFAQFIQQTSGMTGPYRPNGVILAPLPVLTQSLSLGAVTQDFNILPPSGTSEAAVSLLGANRSLEGFLLAGATISGPAGFKPLVVGAHDTVDSILRRFKLESGVEVTLAQLAVANASTPALLTAGVPFMLPPNQTDVTGTITPLIPPPGSTGESAIVFPVSVSVEMTRAHGLVAPDFLGATAVYQTVSSYTPRGVGNNSAPIGLTDFARNFEQAFAADQLKCAVAQENAISDPKQSGKIWAVNFGTAGVSGFAVAAADPQFYSLAPLSTQLLTGTLPVRPYQSGSGLGAVVNKRFDAVDLDSWMARFLSTVDLFLSTPYAVSAFNLGTGQSGPSARANILLPLDLPLHGPIGVAGRPGVPDVGAPVGSPAFEGVTGTTGADGPGNYDDIVTAKYLVARALRRNIVPILDGVGTSSGYYADAAKDSLYQQMLVQLSNAYSVNTVVQYPVNILSPCITPAGSSGPFAPRASIKLIPDFYVSAPGTVAGTLQDAVEYFAVSTPFLAETIAALQGLLVAGATVKFGEKTPYTIKPSDSINHVAAYFGLDTDPNVPGYWEAWTPFAEAIATQPIMVAAASYPVVRIARPLGQGDTLNMIAEFFGVDAATTGEANQSLAGIFLPQSIDLDGYQPYPVQATDTLSTIAASIKPVPPSTPLTVGELADLLATRSSLLNVAKTLYLTQSLPDVTISSTKVSLGPVDSQQGPGPALPFLFSVKHPKQYSKVFLNLKFVMNEIEFGISNVPGMAGYQASSWLTFVLPIGAGQQADVGIATSLGQIQIPLPLRSYPVPPTLVRQSGRPTAENDSPPEPSPATAIAQGRLWDYRFDFRSASSAQDTDHVEVTFNSPGAGGSTRDLLGTSRTDIVFAALAEFIDAYPRLIEDLAKLPMLSPGQPDDTASVAVQVLDIFASQIAGALNSSPGTAAIPASQWPELNYRYRLRTEVVNSQFKQLHLGLESGPTGLGPLWPEVLVKSPTAPTAGTGPDAGFLQLSPGGATGMTATYDYPLGITASVPLTQRFLFRARDVLQNQNAWSGIYLTRNDDLISSGPLGAISATGSSGPQGAIPTKKAFLYQTPLVRFVDPYTPFLVNRDAIDIAGLPGPSGPSSPVARTLTEHIENMLDAVLEIGPSSPPGSNRISILCSYTFPAGRQSGPEALLATTPIRLMPARGLTPSSKFALASELSYSIKQWGGWQRRSDNGLLAMDVSVFFVAAGASGPMKPILEFENLQIPIQEISNSD